VGAVSLAATPIAAQFLVVIKTADTLSSK